MAINQMMGHTYKEAKPKALRVNIGCGQAPTEGWRNFDNSLSLRLARFPLLTAILMKLKLLRIPQYEFIRFARKYTIEYGDATKGLPVQDESVDVLYTSHMLEHLDRAETDKFLKEAFRILRPAGLSRIAVPDIERKVNQYKESGDADAFIESTLHMCTSTQILCAAAASDIDWTSQSPLDVRWQLIVPTSTEAWFR